MVAKQKTAAGAEIPLFFGGKEIDMDNNQNKNDRDNKNKRNMSALLTLVLWALVLTIGLQYLNS